MNEHRKYTLKHKGGPPRSGLWHIGRAMSETRTAHVVTVLLLGDLCLQGCQPGNFHKY